jgi:hypothetical protein
MQLDDHAIDTAWDLPLGSLLRLLRPQFSNYGRLDSVSIKTTTYHIADNKKLRGKLPIGWLHNSIYGSSLSRVAEWGDVAAVNERDQSLAVWHNGNLYIPRSLLWHLGDAGNHIDLMHRDDLDSVISADLASQGQQEFLSDFMNMAASQHLLDNWPGFGLSPLNQDPPSANELAEKYKDFWRGMTRTHLDPSLGDIPNKMWLAMREKWFDPIMAQSGFTQLFSYKIRTRDHSWIQGELLFCTDELRAYIANKLGRTPSRWTQIYAESGVQVIAFAQVVWTVSEVMPSRW